MRAATAARLPQFPGAVPTIRYRRRTLPQCRRPGAAPGPPDLRRTTGPDPVKPPVVPPRGQSAHTARAPRAQHRWVGPERAAAAPRSRSSTGLTLQDSLTLRQIARSTRRRRRIWPALSADAQFAMYQRAAMPDPTPLIPPDRLLGAGDEAASTSPDDCRQSRVHHPVTIRQSHRSPGPAAVGDRFHNAGAGPEIRPTERYQC